MIEPLYPHLTLGYIGKRSASGATLNAAFYAEFFSGDYDLDAPLLFPQRVPRTGFFDELAELEHAYGFASKFSDQKASIIQQLTTATENRLINYCTLLLKTARFNTLISELRPSNNLSLAKRYEFDLLVEIAKINRDLSNAKCVNITGLLSLAERAKAENELPQRIQMQIFMRLVVTAFRYCRSTNDHETARFYADKAREFTDNLEPKSFTDLVLKSVCYRGLAMAKHYDADYMDQALQKVESIARSIVPSNALERAVRDENLYTGLQTLAKWAITNKNLEKAEAYLREMTVLDPLDSTGFTELGFFLAKQGRHSEAEKSFLTASLLGPPAVGMTLYYAAKACQSYGNEGRALEMFHEVAEIDPSAISPWLEILNYYIKIRNANEGSLLAKRILANPDLKDQLNEDEYHAIYQLSENSTLPASAFDS